MKIFSYTTAVRQDIQDFLHQKQTGSSEALAWNGDILKRLAPYATTGKLLRGSLVCFSYEAFAGRKPSKQVLHAAAAVELAHSGLLIHDDIMDDDSLRRGQPSMHEQYRQLGVKEKLADTEHLGRSMAIAGGDAAIFMGFELLAGCPAEVIELFTGQLAKTCAGQMQDVYLEAGAKPPSKEAIFTLMETKTAAYTVAMPLALGAALAGQDAKTIKALQAIGIGAGTIFQIRDDELGVLGNPIKTGKPVGSDITEGKKTLLHYYLLEKATAADRKKLQSIFGDSHSKPIDIGWVQGRVEHYGIPSLLNYEISRLEEQAGTAIQALQASQTTKKELKELIRFCAQRQS